MPIKLNLDRVMAERQVSLTQLADRIGITLANLSILKTNKAHARSAVPRARLSAGRTARICFSSGRRCWRA